MHRAPNSATERGPSSASHWPLWELLAIGVWRDREGAGEVLTHGYRRAEAGQAPDGSIGSELVSSSRCAVVRRWLNSHCVRVSPVFFRKCRVRVRRLMLA